MVTNKREIYFTRKIKFPNTFLVSVEEAKHFPRFIGGVALAYV